MEATDRVHFAGYRRWPRSLTLLRCRARDAANTRFAAKEGELMRRIMSHKVAGRLARTVLPGVPLVGLVLGFWASFAMARAGAYLLDLIRTEPYRSAWTRMLAKEHDVPRWIEDFALTGQGVNTPAHLVPVGYRAFSLATLCKPHDCAANMLYVVFAPDGSQAFAKLVEAGKAPRLFGHPDASVTAALDEATKASGQN
jgi:hypothetical protein